jgi:hypothetical protein
MQAWRGKQGQACTYCGDQAGPLEYHHRQPSRKLFSLGGFGADRWDDAVIADEIAKCDLACHKCHRVVHRAANTAYRMEDGEAHLRRMIASGLKPIHVDAALTLLHDMKGHSDVAARLLRRGY